jgi:peptidoglycan hydrolase-like protein with peptidoglycan-binding domain
MFLPSTITLKPGDSGDFVAELQKRLSKIDFYPSDAINGMYDGLTTGAVRSFQSAQGLSVDGIAGPETLRRLNGVLSGDSGDSKPESSSSEEEQKAIAEKHLFQQTMLQQTPLAEMAVVNAGTAPQKETAHAVETKPVELTQAAPPAVTQEALDKQATEKSQAEQQQRQQQDVLRQNTGAQQAQLVDMLRDALNKVPQPEAAAAQQKQASELQQAQQAQQAQKLEKPVELVKSDQPTKDAAKPEAGAALEKSARHPLVQKIIDYLESKMPADVVRDVMNIGANMARAGVREAPIPSGDTVRAPEAIAGRGPEQQAARGG